MFYQHPAWFISLQPIETCGLLLKKLIQQRRTLKHVLRMDQGTVAHICHGKTYFSTAKHTFPRQNLLFHGKTYFSTAKLTFSRQNLLLHGKTYFSTAKLTFSRQNLLLHGKTYFSTAKLTSPRQNLLFHGKTYIKSSSSLPAAMLDQVQLKVPGSKITGNRGKVSFAVEK